MIKVYYNKLYPCYINKNIIASVVKEVASILKKKDFELEINVVDDVLMKKINKDWRGINKTTDVLSFAWEEDKKIKSNYIGQIYISYPQIKKQAKEFKLSIKEEFFRMIVHSLLHLWGYDHKNKKQEKTMFDLQEQILLKLI